MQSPDTLQKDHQGRLERAKDRSIMILTPVARCPVVEYTASLASTLLLLTEHGIRCTFQFVIGGSVVHRARNELLAYFLASDFTDCLFVDDDMQWSPASVLRLLCAERPVIGAAGRMRAAAPNSDPRVWCWRPDVKDGTLKQEGMGEIAALGVGGAFLMINRGVLIDMIEAHPEWKCGSPADWPDAIKPYHYEVFRPEQHGETFISEDYVFCNRVRESGNQVWVDPTIRLGHVGSFNHSGSLSEILQES